MPKWIHNRAEHILAKNPSMPKSEAFAIATQQSHSVGKSPKGYGTPQGRHTAKAKYDTPSNDKKTANPGHLESSKMAGLARIRRLSEFATKHPDKATQIMDPVMAASTSHAKSLFNRGIKAKDYWSSRGGQHHQEWAKKLEEKLTKSSAWTPNNMTGFWRAHGGITPPGFKTPAQRLQGSMNMGAYKAPAMKPLNIKVGSLAMELSKIAGLGASVMKTLRDPNVREHGPELAGLGVLAAPGLDILQSRARARMAGDTSPEGAEKRQLMGETGHALADVGGLGVLMGPEILKLRHHG